MNTCKIVELIGLIQHIRGVFESHRIAESGASAAHHCDAKPGWLGILGSQNLLHLAHGRLGQLNHFSDLLSGELSTNAIIT